MKNSNTREFERATREIRRKKPNHARAVAWLYEAMTKGDHRATYALATWYPHGHVLPRNRERAVELLRVAARTRPEAMYDLAVCFAKGQGVPKDEREAFRLYKKAARRGDADAIHEVGRCLYWGTGTTRNRVLADRSLAEAERRGVTD